MGMDIQAKIEGAPGLEGKFISGEMNLIVDTLNSAIGEFNGVDALKLAIASRIAPNVMLSNSTGVVYLAKPIANLYGGDINLNSLQGVSLVVLDLVSPFLQTDVKDGLCEVDTIIFPGEIERELKSDFTYSLTEGGNIFILDFDTGKFKVLDNTYLRENPNLDKLGVNGLTFSVHYFAPEVREYGVSYIQATNKTGLVFIDRLTEIRGIIMQPGVYYVNENDVLERIYTDDEKALLGKSYVGDAYMRSIYIPAVMRDVDGAFMGPSYGRVITIDDITLMFTGTLIYVKVGDGLYKCLGDINICRNEVKGIIDYDFIANGTNNTSPEHEMSFVGDFMDVVIDGVINRNVGGELNNVISLPGGGIPFKLYGKNITKCLLSPTTNTMHIEKNDKQTDAAEMFKGLADMVEFTANPITFGNVVSMRFTWQDCTSLTSFPVIDTSKVIDMTNAWSGCTILKTFPSIDITSVAIFIRTFSDCPALVCMGGFVRTDMPSDRYRYGDVFLNTPELLRPTAIEQGIVELGEQWVNDLPCSDPLYHYDFIASAITSVIGDAISFKGDYIDVVVDNVVTRTVGDAVAKTSITLPIDTVCYIYGKNITNSVFSGDIHGIHIEKNSQQINADNMFRGLTNLINLTANQDTFSEALSMEYICYGCNKLLSFPLINTGNVTSMRFSWEGCVGLTEFPLLDTSSVTTMANAWSGCTNLKTFPSIDTSATILISGAWRDCSSLVVFPSIDVSNVTVMLYAWTNCTSLVCMGGFTRDASKVISATSAFLNALALIRPTTAEREIILNGDTWVNDLPCNDPSYSVDFVMDVNVALAKQVSFIGTAMDVSGAIYTGDGVNVNIITLPVGDNIKLSGTNITEFRFLDSGSILTVHIEKNSKQISARNMFYNQVTLTNITANANCFSNVKDMYYICYGCTGLASFPLIDTSDVTSMHGAWSSCVSLETFPSLITRMVTTLREAWFNCKSLITFPIIDFFSVNNINEAWKNCASLVCMGGFLKDIGGSTLSLGFNALSNTPALIRPTADEFSQVIENNQWINDIPCDDPSYGIDFVADATIGGTESNIEFIGDYMDVTTNNITLRTIGDGVTLVEAPLPIGSEVVIKGLNISRARFNGSPIRVHIESNSKQTDATNMFMRMFTMTTFTANPNAFGSVTNMSSTWNQCWNLTDFPMIDTTSVIDMEYTWYYCQALTSFPLLDTSNVINMYFTWAEDEGLLSFPLLDTSKVTDMRFAWYECGALTSFPLLDTSNVVTLYYTWWNCFSLTTFPAINTSKVVDISFAWIYCESMLSFPMIDTSSVIDMLYTWSWCERLTEFPAIDTSNVTNIRGAWQYNKKLVYFPMIDTSNVVDMVGTWHANETLTSFPSIDISSVVTLDGAWRDCLGLTSFPWLNLASVDDITQSWSGCENLLDFPVMDFSNISIMSRTWKGCTSLTTFQLIDLSSTTNLLETWAYCTSLVCMDGFLRNAGSPNITDGHRTFYASPALVRPTLTEQNSVSLGREWINDTAC